MSISVRPIAGTQARTRGESVHSNDRLYPNGSGDEAGAGVSTVAAGDGYGTGPFIGSGAEGTGAFADGAAALTTGLYRAGMGNSLPHSGHGASVPADSSATITIRMQFGQSSLSMGAASNGQGE